MGCSTMAVTQRQKADYASVVTRVLLDVLADQQNVMPGVVWHYTPYETVVKILGRKSL